MNGTVKMRVPVTIRSDFVCISILILEFVYCPPNIKEFREFRSWRGADVVT